MHHSLISNNYHLAKFTNSYPHSILTNKPDLICARVFIQDVGRLDEIRKARDKARAAFEESEKTRQAAAMGGVVGTDFASEMVTTYSITQLSRSITSIVG